MSRRIEQHTTAYTEEYRKLHNTKTGKLLFTDYKGQKCALLMSDNRLTAVHVIQEQGEIGAIYVGIVRNVVPNINACFVEYQEGKIGFLPLKEATAPFVCNRSYDGRLIQGDALLVQVTREAQKTKQASLTAHISLSNDYFALALGSAHIGYSTKLEKAQKSNLCGLLKSAHIMQKDGCLSQELFHISTAYAKPTFGLIVRTKSADLLAEDTPEETTIAATESSVILQLKKFLEECNLFLNNAVHRVHFSCIKEADSIFSDIMDKMIAPEEYQELITDDESLYTKLAEYVPIHFPEKKLRLYEDNMLSLNKLYNLEGKLEEALGERVWLKSGGYLIIQPTEALTVIDVNSGKFEAKNKAGEEAVLKINREAAEEIAIQLRVRNLSGIIIADFINMQSEACKQEITSYMQKLVKTDKIRTTVVDMTPLGLMELTRKKITRPLAEYFRRV